MSSTVMFGSEDRLRVEEAGSFDPFRGVRIIQERLCADGSWREIGTIPIPEGKIGDVCAMLARTYDVSLDRKMAGSKKS